MGFLGGLFGTRDSPFPAWLERRHPVLARWRENAPYLAFRARRRDHSYPLLQRLGNLRTFWQILWVILALPMPLVMLVCMYIWGCWGLVFPLPIMVVAAWVPRLMKRTNPSTIPWRLTDLYLQPRVFEQAILDFYLTANNGRDIAEGVYLETVEEDLEVLLIGGVVVMAILPLICYLLPDSMSFWGWMLTLSLLAATHSLFLTLVDSKTIHGIYGQVEVVFGRWKGSSGTAETAAGYFGKLIDAFAFCFVLFVFALLAIGVQTMIVYTVPASAVEFAEDVRFCIVFVLWGGICTLYFRRLHSLLPRRGSEHIQLDQGTDLYLEYVQGRNEGIAGG